MAKTLTFYDKDGVTEISARTLSDILSGTSDTPVKIGVKNSGSSALGAGLKCTIVKLGNNDGWSQLRIGRDVSTISPPWGLTAVVGSPAASGTWSEPDTVYYVVTALNAVGETIQSSEVQALIDDVTKKVTITWEQVTGATGYRLYRTTVLGVYGAASLVVENVGIDATSYIDDGSVTVTGTSPLANLSGGASPNYGTWPALSTVPLLIRALAIGQEVFIWIGRVVPVSVDDSMNPRIAGLLFTE